MRAAAVLALLLVRPASAIDDDSAALGLADKTLTQPAPVLDWHLFTEAAASAAPARSGGAAEKLERLSFGALYDAQVAPRWRAVFSDRLDAASQQAPARRAVINTLQDGYLSWQPSSDRIADLGRINTRYGVGYGFNPTDYFRTGAVRSIVSSDPESLRENRLGSVMARGQAVWVDSSVTLVYSPKLATRPASGAFDLDLGATNDVDRALLVVSRRFSDQLTPQALVFGAAGEEPQIGLDLTAVPTDATVLHLEWSAGRSSSLLAQATALPADTAFRSRLAAGFTFTTATKLSLILEYEYDGSALGARGWTELARTSPGGYGVYRNYVAEVQDPPTRRRIFARAFWQDAGIVHLDLSSYVFFDAIDRSRQAWFEARYHWPRLDLAVQWQHNSGSPFSEYGALPQCCVTQLLARYFL